MVNPIPTPSDATIDKPATLSDVARAAGVSRWVAGRVLNGGQGKKERTGIIKAIQETPQDRDLIVVATGQYLGEGFDCPRLNTLFMTFPVAFKGNMVQYAGRVLRASPGKTNAEVYDYVDVQTPVLKNMFFRRQKAYKSLGFESGTLLG